MFLPKTVVFKNKVGGSREGEGTPNRKLSLCNSDVKSIKLNQETAFLRIDFSLKCVLVFNRPLQQDFFFF